MAKREYTQQQKGIINSNGKLILCVARAGAGKTSTLEGYAEARPNNLILYVAYTKSVQVEASQRFPENVECLTTHALAMRKVGYQYQHKLGNLRITEVANELGVSMNFAKRMIDGVTNFVTSPDPRPSDNHMDTSILRNSAEFRIILEGVELLWRRMKDVNDVNIKMTHDGYLKLFQLENPVLEYDDILFDECQDANPVTADIVLQQKCTRVLVGDPHQSIFSFRNAINAIELVEPDETHYLTESFRFGRGVASVANAILAAKGETRGVIGSGKHQVTRFSVNKSKPYAVIARTNAMVFEEAISALNAGKKIKLMGEIKDYPFSLILDAYHLMTGNKSKIQAPHIKGFRDFYHLEDFAEKTEDTEARVLVRLAKKYRNNIPTLINRITMANQKDMNKADVLLTTAHKSKGLEFDQVVLCDDFLDFFEKDGTMKDSVDTEDLNLYYVAATRAQQALEINPKLLKFLQSRGWSMERANDQPKQPGPKL